jgi:hypothetical protein
VRIPLFAVRWVLGCRCPLASRSRASRFADTTQRGHFWFGDEREAEEHGAFSVSYTAL